LTQQGAGSYGSTLREENQTTGVEHFMLFNTSTNEKKKARKMIRVHGIFVKYC